MVIVSAITLAIAVLGAVLGILNTWNSINDRRVRLRVTPQWSIAPGFSGLAIEVVNLSSFAITVTEIGLTIGPSKGTAPSRFVVLGDRIVHGREPPTRLDRRETTSLVFTTIGLEEHDIRKAYARTADGSIAYGSSGALRQFLAENTPPRRS
ncbi:MULTISPECIES: hypothetical protein [unclassified Sphingomonas]|uniref:hypothetical protein n=1 Tax=unclassified Sphingomonas TaxID=196159 RepID=UPI00226AA7B4|nr:MULTISPECIES: hypothetical protein [unclassified Sphingomonas]